VLVSFRLFCHISHLCNVFQLACYIPISFLCVLHAPHTHTHTCLIFLYFNSIVILSKDYMLWSSSSGTFLHFPVRFVPQHEDWVYKIVRDLISEVFCRQQSWWLALVSLSLLSVADRCCLQPNTCCLRGDSSRMNSSWPSRISALQRTGVVFCYEYSEVWLICLYKSYSFLSFHFTGRNLKKIKKSWEPDDT
jgi:hypothetical protein